MRATVIIATMNRADQLNGLTLQSLFQQDTDAFDIVVWDASATNETALVCKAYGERVHYCAAPRKGLVKQRNDAVCYAKERLQENEIIVFLDDDVVLSKDAISGLLKTFDMHPEIMGVGIPIHGQEIKTNVLKKIAKALFLNFEYSTRYMTAYAYGYQVQNEKNSSVVNWLSGCSMSFRKHCFDYYAFDERLCKFGGYSLAEDAVFTCTLDRAGKRLMLSDEGSLVHVRDGNSRLDYRKMVASFLYNKNILFHILNRGKSLPIRAFWRMAFCWNEFYNLSSLFGRAIRSSESKAYFEGIRDVIQERRMKKK